MGLVKSIYQYLEQSYTEFDNSPKAIALVSSFYFLATMSFKKERDKIDPLPKMIKAIPSGCLCSAIISIIVPPRYYFPTSLLITAITYISIIGRVLGYNIRALDTPIKINWNCKPFEHYIKWRLKSVNYQSKIKK